MQSYSNKAQGCFLYNKVTKLKTNHNFMALVLLCMVLFPI